MAREQITLTDVESRAVAALAARMGMAPSQMALLLCRWGLVAVLREHGVAVWDMAALADELDNKKD